MKLFHRHFLLVLMLLTNLGAYSQEITFNKIQPPIGKTFEHVTGMVQDAQGFIWLATKRGLFRYDGYQMISFKNNPLDKNSLATDALETIAVDLKGNIWIGTQGFGLDRFDPSTGIFTHFRNQRNNPGSLGSDHVTTLLVDKTGILWVGTNEGLSKYEPSTGTFQHYRYLPNDSKSISSNEVVSIYEDRSGRLWIGTGSVYNNDKVKREDGGLNLFDKNTGTFTRYLHDPKNPQSLANNKVRAIFEDSKGNFWIGTAGDGLHTMNRETGHFTRHSYDATKPEKLSRPPINKTAPLDHISFITEDPAGAIWIGTVEQGLNIYNPDTKKVSHYFAQKDTAGAFTDHTAWAGFRSKDGVMWISSLFGNIYRVTAREKTIPHYRTDNGVFAMYEDTDGSVWLGTEKGLVIQQPSDRGYINTLNDTRTPYELTGIPVGVITKDRQGNLWLGTPDGLRSWNAPAKIFKTYRHNEKDSKSLSHNVILTVYEDSFSQLWVGTLKGLNRMERNNGSFRRFIFHPGDSSSPGLNIVNVVLEDRKHQVWAGCVMIGDIHLLNTATGTFKSFLEGKGIHDLHEDAAGILWAGGDEGLFKYNSAVNDFEPYSDSATHSTFTFIRSITEDDQQNLWLVTSTGIVTLNTRRQVTRIYGKNYGITGNQLCIGSSYKGTDGKLFFGTNSGYFVFPPGEANRATKSPDILLTDFRLAGRANRSGKDSVLNEPLWDATQIRLRHNQNAFVFTFAVIDYSSPEDNRHFFMLENYDEQWNEAGSERKAIYYNVPPGKYVFRVKGANSNGIWTNKSIHLVVTPPWWQSWWFRIAAVLAIVALIYSLVRWRLQQKFRHQLEQSENEKQLAEFQQQKIELEMQALRAQMNPHFIFNCLSSINRFILKNESEAASDYLTKFSRLIRMVLNNSKKTFISLEDELEMLRLYLEMERLRFQYSFNYNISFRNEIEPSGIFIPPLLLQPFAENAIWHGLMHKEGNGHLDIELSLENNILTCIITDDGIGRKNAAVIKSKSAQKNKSLGLQITTERLALLNRDIGGQTFFTIEDITDQSGYSAGTKVILKIQHQDMTEVN